MPDSDAEDGAVPDGSRISLQRVAEEIRFTSDMAMALFHSSPDGIIVVDGAGVIRMANQQAELLTGYHHSELRGRPVEILVPEDQRDDHARHRTRFVDDPHTRAMGLGLQLRVRRKDGREVDVDINLAPVVTAQGVYVITTFRRTRENRLGRGGHTVTGPAAGPAIDPAADPAAGPAAGSAPSAGGST